MAETPMDISRLRDPAANITRAEITLDHLLSRKRWSRRAKRDRLARSEGLRENTRFPCLRPTPADVPLV
jgi:hypothetical protein